MSITAVFYTAMNVASYSTFFYPDPQLSCVEDFVIQRASPTSLWLADPRWSPSSLDSSSFTSFWIPERGPM